MKFVFLFFFFFFFFEIKDREICNFQNGRLCRRAEEHILFGVSIIFGYSSSNGIPHVIIL